MSEDVFKLFKELFEKVEKETKEKVGNKYWTWSEHYQNWIDIFLPLLRETSEFEKNNALMIFRLMELQNQLIWIMMSVLYGRYHSAIRELRYFMESMLQAYYLDNAHPQTDIHCKLEILKEIEKNAFGARLIDRLDIDNKQILKETYSILSKYTHSSYKELAPAIEGKEDSRVTFAFNMELFDKCTVLTNRVFDVIYFIVINRFPQLVTIIKTNTMTIKSLKQLDCKLTLSHLKKES